ncbi:MULTISPECIES: hypothetical protein [Burkholderiaceae]|uniref:hypothetical protein n=1 Tax=Burkholderiaceae TaxID=119060 RepID=UPI000493AF01|nr:MULTISPECIES: hypothetical protein [Burkholderiaceae]MCA3776084.1 hypothetical protein [Cutibacterium sp.]AVA33660.1 hypothetical protein C3Z06_08415 [Cupriavidus metallidurans]MBY4707052.1 hypothetical protein [Ralstonia insidiosa]MCA3186799.1 hypothetical protein [Cupriavidus sp.]MCA3193846.1 hypothetical protein [Cupriavidus sp.]
MEDSRSIAGPISIARPRGAHRFDAFSPKLARRVMFYQRPAVEQWLLLEADPAVVSFCERPGYAQIDGCRRLADFWVRYGDREELILLDDARSEDEAPAANSDLDDKALSIRYVAIAELAAARIWIDNWQRMLPYLVANRDLVAPTVPGAIERFLKEPQRLLAIEREFSTGDPVLVRAALFGLLHAGKVTAQELRTQPLSLLTMFVAREAKS